MNKKVAENIGLYFPRVLIPLIVDYLGTSVKQREHYDIKFSNTIRQNFNCRNSYIGDIRQFIVYNDRAYIVYSGEGFSVFDFSTRKFEWHISGRFCNVTMIEEMIYLLSIKEERLLVLSKSGKCLKEYALNENHMTSFQNELYFLDEIRLCIDIFTKEMQYLRTIEIPPKSCYFTVTKNFIIIGGHDSNIHLLSHDGKEINRFPSWTHGDLILVNQEIYMIDCYKHKIRVYALDGSFLRTFKNEKFMPRLALNDNRLYIVDHKGITVYDVIPDVE